MVMSIESYIYCIGCMGCVGKSGVVIIFLGDEDIGVMYDFKQMFSKSFILKVLEELKKYVFVQLWFVCGGY